MPDVSPDIRQLILRRLNILTGLVVALTLALGGGAIYVWIHTEQATNALCALRADLEVRVASSRQFLAEHPHGLAGIPAASIQQSIDNAQRTVYALRGLSC